MGGFGLPPPGRQPRPQRGGVYGQPQGTVPYKTPMGNQMVEGISNFVESFKQTQDQQKQQAFQEFMMMMQSLDIGIPVDMKKAARLARTAGLDFDYDSPTPRQKAQQQTPPPMPQGGGGMAGGMAPGGGMFPGGGTPPPQGGGGLGGFIKRLGGAMRMPEAPGPIPQDAPIMGWLQQQQQMGQQQQQLGQIDQQTKLLEAQKKRELAQMALDVIKTGDPQKTATLHANGLLDLPEAVASIYHIAGQTKSDPNKALGALYNEITGASKASAQHEQTVNRTALSLLDWYNGDFEKATAASRAVLDGGKLPDDLKPKGEGPDMEAIVDGALDLSAKYIGLDPGVAFSISLRLADPTVPEEEKAAEMSKLGKFRTHDEERLSIARQHLGVALEGLGIRKTDVEKDARIRSRVTDILIASTDPVTGKIDFGKARARATNDARSGYYVGLDEDLSEIIKYIGAAERNADPFQTTATDLLKAYHINSLMDQMGQGGPKGKLPPPTQQGR